MAGWQGPVMLGDASDFPPPEKAGENGLLAMGGDLSPWRLLTAYARGIFPWPWYENQPMLWWCPDPRCVLYPDEMRVSRSLRQRIRVRRFEVRLDTDFEAVIRGCATVPRRNGPGTWLTDEMIDAYVELHRLGFAHSAESYRDGWLVGGLYGVALGGAFFGESMFHLQPDASKVAFVRLVRQLEAWGFGLVDCQMPTSHLERFGARSIPRRRFLAQLAGLVRRPNRQGCWRFEEA